MRLVTIDCREIGGRPGVMVGDDEILDLAGAPRPGSGCPAGRKRAPEPPPRAPAPESAGLTPPRARPPANTHFSFYAVQNTYETDLKNIITEQAAKISKLNIIYVKSVNIITDLC